MLTLDELFADPPLVHAGETEGRAPVAPGESVLDAAALERLAEGKPTCYGISRALGGFLSERVAKGNPTLETGTGVSTLVFALAGADHTCVTPNGAEVRRLRAYAGEKGVALETVEFVVEDSADALPARRPEPLEVVLLDGKHAFPWPVLDWFYTARSLREGGLVVLDDRELPAVALVERFLASEPGWERLEAPDDRACVFRKLAGSLDDRPWHAQTGLFRRSRLEDLLRAILDHVGTRSTG